MGSGLEVVVMSAIVGMVGFWLGWTGRYRSLMRGEGPYADSPMPGAIANAVAGAAQDGIQDTEARHRASARDIQIDIARFHFMTALVAAGKSSVGPTHLEDEARQLAIFLVDRNSEASKRVPFLQ